jgi:hypothetical protein
MDCLENIDQTLISKEHLAVISLQGEELTWDYGDRNTESVAAHPWLKKKKKNST